MKEDYFIDVNIFMYAAGKEYPYKLSCITILDKIEKKELNAVINTEIIQEILYRYSRLGIPEKGIKLCEEVLAYPLTVLPITLSDVKLAVRLFEEYHKKGLKVRDAIHSAVMKNNKLTKIITVDKDFDVITFVTRIDPIGSEEGSKNILNSLFEV